MEANTDRLFVCYANEDRERVLPLVEAIRSELALRALPVDPWMDVSDLKAGEQWNRTIDETLKSSVGLLFILSPRSIHSEWVRHELEFAASAPDRLIITVLLQESLDLPPALEKGLHLDLSGRRTPEKIKEVATRVADATELYLKERTSHRASNIDPTKSTGPSDPDATAPFDPGQYELSHGALAILEGAAVRLGGGARSAAVSTSAVLLEMSEQGRLGNDPQWIGDFLRVAVAAQPTAYRELIDKYYGGRIERKRVPPGQRASHGPTASLMRPGLEWALNRAKEIARQTTGSTKICGRHLLAALITDPPQPYSLGARKLLDEIGLDVPLLRQRLYEWVRGYGDDDSAWRAVLVGTGTTSRRRGGFDADGTGGRDLLDIEEDVLALATLIAARDTSPPLSIGLFGDWGSGKTFFMEKLRRAVAQLSKEARDSEVMQRELPFYKRIVQIEFNAWHYVEGDLWASMVDHMLDNLRLFDGQPSTVTAQLQEHWIKQLGFVEKVKVEADRKSEEAAARVTRAEVAVGEAEAMHETKKRELQQLSQKSIARDFQLSGALTVITDALEPLGIKPVNEAVTELQSSLRQARSAVERGNAALTPLLHAKDKADRWRSLLIILVGAPVAAAVVGLVLTWMGADRIAQLSAFATGAAGLLTGGAKWIRNQAEWVSRQTTEIEKAQRTYDEALAKALADTAEQMARTEQELALARQDYMLAQQKAEQARREQQAALADLAAASTSRLLGRFIQDRAASTDYRKHLGVLAVVRQDFQQLSQLIEEDNWKLAPDGPEDERFAGRLEKITNLQDEAQGADYRINRIVLYIDDLDRCPPAKVVDVLQAVHLLLAFPLFVVVVGVDARWISRSLETRYRELLHVDNAESEVDIAQMFGVVRSEDYLEKIFQIPLWLRSMDANSARKMVQGLLRTTPGAPPAVKKLEDQGDGVTNPSPDNIPLTGSVTGPGVPQSEAATSPTTAAPPAKPMVPNLESLQPPQDFELSVIDSLSPLLGRSPRALKRFVNLYRLIKARLTPTEHDAFVRQNENVLGDYEAVLFLLAVDTGLPRVSRAVFDALLAANLSGDDPARVNVKELIETLDKHAAADTRDWATLKAWMSHRQKVERFDHGIGRLASWVPLVSRFSFQAAHLEENRDAHSPLRRSQHRST